jgi:hypothetical protein
MTLVYEAVGVVAIGLGLGGTWLAARHRSGWLVCIVSSTLWLPTLVVGGQWVAVSNVALSIAICVRNFSAQRTAATRRRESLDVAVRGSERETVARAGSARPTAFSGSAAR